MRKRTFVANSLCSQYGDKRRLWFGNVKVNTLSFDVDHEVGQVVDPWAGDEGRDGNLEQPTWCDAVDRNLCLPDPAEAIHRVVVTRVGESQRPRCRHVGVILEQQEAAHSH